MSSVIEPAQPVTGPDCAAGTSYEIPSPSTYASADGTHPLHASFRFHLCLFEPIPGHAEAFHHRSEPISTVEAFWNAYCHIPDFMSPQQRKIRHHLFRDGIDPMWEDPANESGGRFTFLVARAQGRRAWETLMLAVIGDEYNLGDEMCGVTVINTNNNASTVTLAVWVKGGSPEAIEKVRLAISVMFPASKPHFRFHSKALEGLKKAEASKTVEADMVDKVEDEAEAQ